jgi:hypothetical protein
VLKIYISELNFKYLTYDFYPVMIALLKSYYLRRNNYYEKITIISRIKKIECLYVFLKK